VRHSQSRTRERVVQRSKRTPRSFRRQLRTKALV
jgi:hypothetical protein